MIKYLYYERCFEYDDEHIIKNQKILNNKPKTNDFGWYTIEEYPIFKCFVDVEKYLNVNKSFPNHLQKICDNLLIETRNKKLETL